MQMKRCKFTQCSFLSRSCVCLVPPSQRARGTARKSGVHMQTVTVGIVGGSDLVKIKEQLGENGTHLCRASHCAGVSNARSDLADAYLLATSVL